MGGKFKWVEKFWNLFTVLHIGVRTALIDPLMRRGDEVCDAVNRLKELQLVTRALAVTVERENKL